MMHQYWRFFDSLLKCSVRRNSQLDILGWGLRWVSVTIHWELRILAPYLNPRDSYRVSITLAQCFSTLMHIEITWTTLKTTDV